ncbi:LytR C-terminal domain-containing protein [Candidatus Gottesmanbacteria bacterium]|nr:LytR C-terminal domain-containing protein [Candidatus Gottesmanbacteria bacterium]
MTVKRKVSAKKTKAPEAEVPTESAGEQNPSQPQFVTQVVEELPVNEGVDVSAQALETIKEKAEEIEEVVEEIQEEKHEEALTRTADVDEPGDGETAPSEDKAEGGAEEDLAQSKAEKKEEEKEVLSELFAPRGSEDIGPSKEAPGEVYPDIIGHQRLGAAPVFLWAVIIIGVALLTGGTLLVIASGLPKVGSLFVKPTPTSTNTPSPTPTPVVAARGDVSVQVLNGGGTPGSAGKAKTFLEGKGYSVANTGNTEEYTYKKTEIHVKPGKEAYLDLLQKDLTDAYTVSTADAKLAADSSFDAQVIVGKE